MPSQPFADRLADYRAVEIPAELEPDARVRFVAKVAAAAQRQATLAQRCDAVLRVTGETLEQDGLILIPHEPAAPSDPAVIGSSPAARPDIDTLWWLTWASIRALAAAGQEKIAHGGIQPGALFLDQAGRVKLGDFGLAPAFEVVCGIEHRRQLLCAVGGVTERGGRALSGTWRLAGEDESHEFGWIAPFFGHELFEGAVRLNPKSDQFALGVLLFLWATGTHPYGAALSDPGLMCYFHLEPFALEDERADWRECFERQAKEFTQDSDRPVLGWWEIVRTLLASDPALRYANLGEAGRTIEQLIPTAWTRASAAIGKALQLLDQGEVHAGLEAVGPWKDEAALPAPWRMRLAPWVAGIDAQKETIVRRQRLRQRLVEGHAALDNLELEPARAAAREVIASPDAEQDVRRDAEELLRFCDEQEQFIRSGADTLSQQYLESARTALGQFDFEEARANLNAILLDPATPGARAAQARQLVAEVELAEQRVEQQIGELEAARGELRQWRLAAARQRVESVLAQAGLPDGVSAQARSLRDEVAQLQARRAEHAQALEQANAAWERVDLPTFEQQLARVPQDVADPQIADPRRELAARHEPLRAALERKRAAEASFADNDLKTARAETQSALRSATLPPPLIDELNALLARCEQAEQAARRAAIEAARNALAKARQAYDAADDDACRRLLETGVLACEHLPGDERGRAEELLKACTPLAKAKELLERTQRCLSDGDFDQALAALDALPREPLPDPLTAEAAQSRQRAETARREFIGAQVAQLEQALASASAALDAGQLDQAEATLNETADSAFLTDELRARISEWRTAIARQRPIVPVLHAAEAALDAQEPDLAEARAALERLPTELPGWAAQRAAALRQRAESVAQQRREAARQQAQAALDAAQRALDEGDPAAAKRHLEEVGAGIELEAALAERRAELVSRATELEEHQRRQAALREARAALDAARRALDEADPAAARRHLQGVGTGIDLDAALAKRHAELLSQATELEERQRREAALRRTRAALDAAEQALEAGDIVAARRRLESAGEGVALDASLAERRERLSARAVELEQRQRREAALRQARTALEAAEQALQQGDTPSAARHLDAVGEGIELEAALARRHEELATLASRLERWLPKVAALEAALERGQTAAVYREAGALLKDSSLPELAARRAQPLFEQAKRRIAARQEEIDAELHGLEAELEQRGRRAKRFGERLQAVAGDPLAAKSQQAHAAELQRRFEALPVPKRSRLPIALAGVLLALGALSAVWYLLPRQAASPPPQPRVEPPPEPPVVVEKTAAERIAEAITRLRDELGAARAAAAASGRSTPAWQAEFDPPDRFPTVLRVRTPDSAEARQLKTFASADELARFALTAEQKETLFPLPPPPPGPSPEEIEAARQRLQREVDAARAAADRPDARAARYVIRFEPAARVPADIFARDERSGEEIALGSVRQEQLTELVLKDEWRAKLYPPPPPPPSAEQVAPQYLDALLAALPEGVASEELKAVGAGRYTVRLQWQGRGLRPYSAIRFDQAGGRFTPPPEQIAPYFRIQIDGLQALEQPGQLRIELDPAYDAAVRLVNAAAQAEIGEVDLAAGSVALAVGAHLANDPRSDARFGFRGRLRQATFTADAETRSAFQRYLRELQRHQLPAAVRQAAAALGLPSGVRIELPAEPAGGGQATATLRGPGDRPLAALPLTWNAAALTYELDADRAAQNIRSGLKRLALEADTRARLRESWPNLRRTLAPPDAAPGAQYFARCDLASVTVAKGQPAEQFAVAVEVAVGPAKAPPEDHLRFPARLRLIDGVLAWDTAALAAQPSSARADVAAALRTLAEDRAFRARRQEAALDELARELGVRTGALRARAGPASLTAEVTRAGQTRRYRWEWDAGALKYANRTETTPPPPRPKTLAGRLAALTAGAQPEPGVFVDVLGDVARAKIARYGAEAYRVAPAFVEPGGDPHTRLVGLSRALQELIAPDTTATPFPVVFVEYFITPEQVYGLSWQVATDADDVITAVTATTAWRALPTAALRAYPRPAAFRAAYSRDEALGERLFGRALGARLSASGGGSYGVVIAPDGPLWLTRWEQVRFAPRAVEKLDWRRAPAVERATALRDILAPGAPNGPDSAWRRAGLWCVPTLAGRWQGEARGIELNLGTLVPDRRPRRAVFTRAGDGALLFAAIEDPTLAGDFGWFDFVKRVRRADIGYRFWDRGWSRASWKETPFTSFSLIQAGP